MGQNSSICARSNSSTVWVNCLDPSMNRDEWTEEEDLRLKAAIEECGYCWSKVAERLPQRTDNQCLRHWLHMKCLCYRRLGGCRKLHL
uniref:Uncharacterized protein n=1 Tax=Salix viminalis TaxID=40686 RepID=A0A6N2KS00_SALVM